jgi:hypothetical protein
MSDLRDVAERAERAVESIPRPPEGFERLARLRRRRHVRRRVGVTLFALAVAAVGATGAARIVWNGPGSGRQLPPAASTSPSVRSAPLHAPAGPVAQQVIEGQTAQRLGDFWFGIAGGDACLRVMPLAVGPSWSFGDTAHDCVSSDRTDPVETGIASGSVSVDGRVGSTVRFTAVYGTVDPRAATVEVLWADGDVSSVDPVEGRFFLVWEGPERPVTVIARTKDGGKVGAASLSAN